VKRVAARWRELARAVAAEVRAARRGDAKALHDLRVACRRLEASLRLWGRGGAAREARALARELRRAAAPAREAEVIRAMLLAGVAGASVLPAALRQQWAAELADDPPRARLPRTSILRLRTRVERASERMVQRDAAKAVAAVVAEIAERRVVAVRALVGALADGASEPLHQARLALKRWRYALEAAAASGASDRSELLVRSLRDWQTRLGRLNDRAQLLAFVASRTRRAGEERSRRFVRRLEALRLSALAALRRKRVAFADPPPRRPPAPRAPSARAAARSRPRAGDPPRSRAARDGARPPRSRNARPAAAR